MAKDRKTKISILKNGHFVTLAPKEQAKFESMQRALAKREARKSRHKSLQETCHSLPKGDN